MVINLRMVLLISIALLGLGVLLLNSDVDNAGPSWLWRGGKNDGLRHTLMRKDGKLRRYTKPLMVFYLAILFVVVWIVVPDAN
jgi:hypothetical protein